MPKHLKACCLHGNLVRYCGFGILITGVPGCGKSWLSAYLIACGAELIAADMVRIHRQKDVWYGQTANVTYQGILHLREYGFIAAPCPSVAIPIHTHLAFTTGKA